MFKYERERILHENSEATMNSMGRTDRASLLSAIQNLNVHSTILECATRY